jgi:hypothetical protein
MRLYIGPGQYITARVSPGWRSTRCGGLLIRALVTELEPYPTGITIRAVGCGNTILYFHFDEIIDIEAPDETV